MMLRAFEPNGRNKKTAIGQRRIGTVELAMEVYADMIATGCMASFFSQFQPLLISYDAVNDMLFMRVASEHFDVIPEGAIPPRYCIEIDTREYPSGCVAIQAEASDGDIYYTFKVSK